MTINEIVGNKLREAREAKRMTQAEVAERLGITRSAYANIELGRNAAGIEYLVKLTEVLERPINFFLDMPPPPPEPLTVSELEMKINDIWQLLTQDHPEYDTTAGLPLLNRLLAVCRQLDLDHARAVLDFATYTLDRQRQTHS